VVELNATQPYRVIELAKAALDCKSLKGKRITVLGLTFKPDTDDIRDTRALPIVTRLIEEGALVTVYDPKGMHNFQKILATEELKVSWGKNLVYASSLRHALTGADACIIQTEWDEFKSLTAVEFKRWMNTPIVIDGRRTFTPTELIAGGVTYLGIGWKNIGY
jgi:UDPglucose 6-dehydrogenase